MLGLQLIHVSKMVFHQHHQKTERVPYPPFVGRIMQNKHGMYIYNGFLAINMSLHSSNKVYTCFIYIVVFYPEPSQGQEMQENV